MENVTRKTLILALILISLGGLLLHLRVHPPFGGDEFQGSDLIPPIFNLLSLILVSWLFLKKETADLAYLLNGLAVIFGVLLMSHLSLIMLKADFSLKHLILGTTLADSLILLGKFMVGKALFESYYPERVKRNWAWSVSWRYLFNGWWVVHFIGIALIYTLGLLFHK